MTVEEAGNPKAPEPPKTPHAENRSAGLLETSEDAQDYAHHLRMVRRRQVLPFIVFLAFIPVMLITDNLGISMDKSFYVYIALYLYLGWRLEHTYCARCGKKVFRRGWHSNPFTLRCMNCGLDHWA